MKVLYIEDNQQLALCVSTLLIGHRYKVGHFALGKTGLERFRQDPQLWDAAIVDLELPDVSGQTLIPEIVAQHPAFSIVVDSGEKQLADRFGLYSLGTSALVSKPCAVQDLLDVLQGLIEMPPIPIK